MSSVVAAAKGKWRSILESVGGIETKYLDGKHHPCPINGEGEDRFRFSNRNEDGNYFCACSDGTKDGFDLLKCCRNMEFKEAAREIESFLGTNSNVRTDKAPEKKSPKKIADDLTRICSGIVKERHEVLRYLRGRGITIEPNDVFQTLTNYGLYHSGVTARMTAMASVLRSKEGKPETLHLTYLQDGVKAPISRPRILATPKTGVAGCAVRLAPVGPDGALGVGEGIESSASAIQLTGIPTWATISANGMSSFELPTDIEVKSLHIFVDADSNFVGQAAGYNLARRITQKNKAIRVCMYSPTGMGVVGTIGDSFLDSIDFNDIIKAVDHGN